MGSDGPVYETHDNEDDELTSFAGSDMGGKAADWPTTAMPAATSGISRVSTELWETDRFDPVAAPVAADRRPADDLTFDPPGSHRPKRPLAAPLFAALAAAIVAAVVVLLAVHPWREGVTAGAGRPTPLLAGSAADRRVGETTPMSPTTSAVGIGQSVRSPKTTTPTTTSPPSTTRSTATKSTEARPHSARKQRSPPAPRQPKPHREPPLHRKDGQHKRSHPHG
jgi:hypothetical protein